MNKGAWWSTVHGVVELEMTGQKLLHFSQIESHSLQKVLTQCVVWSLKYHVDYNG